MTTTIEQVAAWKSAASEVLDVRPALAQGDEPFVPIMEAAERVPSGGSLLVIAPFEPAPLYSVLGDRGFTHDTARVSDSEWAVRFTRQG